MRNAKDALVAAAVGKESADAAMRVVSEQVGVLGAGISVWRGTTSLLGASWFGIPAAFHRAYAADFAARDPWTERIHHLEEGLLLDAEALLPRRSFRETAFYEDLCRPHAVRDLCGGVLLREGPFTITFGLLRASDAHGTGAREIRAVKRIAAELVCLARSDLDRLRLASASEVLSAIPFGTFVVDVVLRRLLDANAAGERLLAAGVVVVSAGEVRVDGEPVPFARDMEATRRLTTRARAVRVVVPAARWTDGRLVRRIYVHHMPSIARERCARAAELYGLSPREATVAEQLLLGLVPKQIAAHHGVAVSTLRSQVRSLYAKLGVDRQAALVALLTEL